MFRTKVDKWINENSRGDQKPDVRLNAEQYKALYDELLPLVKQSRLGAHIASEKHLREGLENFIYRGCAVVFDPEAKDV